ncbi:hypothetical protein pipiens_011599 [Culex pipiens pipiens]|uniref:Uncharacterized protein n=1 Tax=Culex pipiens pipiens TaxID=38569 RepID=A0ABD1D738_CULPP
MEDERSPQSISVAADQKEFFLVAVEEKYPLHRLFALRQNRSSSSCARTRNSSIHQSSREHGGTEKFSRVTRPADLKPFPRQ